MMQSQDAHVWKWQREDHDCLQVSSTRYGEVIHLPTIYQDIGPSLSQVHCVRVDTILVCPKAMPIYPQGPALKNIGKEEADGPDGRDYNHSPDRNDEDATSEDSDADSVSILVLRQGS